MDELSLRQLLVDVSKGTCDPDEAVRQLRRLPYADLGFARVDHHRSIRQGFPEAVYGPGKSPEQCARIVAELLRASTGPVLLTRAQPEQVGVACSAATAGGFEEPVVTAGAGAAGAGAAGSSYGTLGAAGLATVVWRGATGRDGRVLVLTAGTADLPVAAECVAVLRALGFAPSMLVDCGVAGVHRLLASVDELA
ncbi:MAG: nickel pincer cofactor biosynthesis protein LarB, partial [Acidimicrobiales bacterium]